MLELIYTHIASDKMPHKWMLVILIVGCISLFFLICLPIDFLLFKRRKRLARLRNECPFDYDVEISADSDVTTEEYPENNSANVSILENAGHSQHFVHASWVNKGFNECSNEQSKHGQESTERTRSDTAETVSTSIDSVDANNGPNQVKVNEEVETHSAPHNMSREVHYPKQNTQRGSLCDKNTVISVEENELGLFGDKRFNHDKFVTFDQVKQNLPKSLQNEYSGSLKNNTGQDLNTNEQDGDRNSNSSSICPSQNPSFQQKYRKSNVSDTICSNGNTPLLHEHVDNNTHTSSPSLNSPIQYEYRNNSDDKMDFNLNIPLQGECRNSISNHVVHVKESVATVFNQIETETNAENGVLDHSSRLSKIVKHRRSDQFSWETLPKTDAVRTMHEYRGSKSKPQTIRTQEFTRSASSKEMFSHSLRHVDPNFGRKDTQLPTKHLIKRVNTLPVLSTASSAFTVDKQLPKAFSVQRKEQNMVIPTNENKNGSIKDGDKTQMLNTQSNNVATSLSNASAVSMLPSNSTWKHEEPSYFQRSKSTKKRPEKVRSSEVSSMMPWQRRQQVSLHKTKYW